ncbi:hypothetical protein GCM10023185_06240 [Hymenobacter saemangeumensis]|uniref:T9SS type A sorting domain-containing protein n=1 Tax=Hymenobacter saemangeumensis TaxID=1084522 RepID=A0ABP8I1J8_9BACT
MAHFYFAGSESCFLTLLRPARMAGALLLAFCYCLPLLGFAQGQPSPKSAKPGGEVELRLAAGTYRLVKGTHTPVAPAEIVEGRYYRLVQFDRLPTDAQRAALAADGRVELLTYLPQNAWVAALKAGTDPALALRGLPVRAVVAVEPEWKLSSSLSSRNYPSHALRAGGRLALRVQVYAPITLATATQRLRVLDAAVAKSAEHPNVLEVTVAVGQERRLAAEPWVQTVEAAPAPPTLEAERDVTNHRANVLNSNLPSGRHLDGTGVTIAIGDDGFVGPHIDFQGRLTNIVQTSDGDHADHVTGIVGGAGNLNPTMRGQATGATLRTYSYYADILTMTGATGQYATQGVRISSHSLGQTCNDGYTSDARTSDQHTRLNPALMYVHSAGNSGTSDCSYGAGAGWANITGGYKMGKNVLTVGNLTHLDVLSSSSSRGPAKDGRIKPDICATGTDVNSTGENNTYNSKSGTSMACPAVSGVLGQLYQAYRNANAGADPNSALIKAAVLNTADDIGNPGPDFKHGYGRINALRAVELLENTRYVTNTLSTGQNQTVSLTVPAGVSQLKVMLYWADYEAAANAATALVNDLDFTLSTPAAGTLQPWVLNPAPNAATLDAAATRGIDHLNNMEQVTLDAPAAGTYTANISGFSIPQGPQRYYVVYSWVENNVRITNPIGGEAFVPGETQVLRWDANTSASGFTLEYSTNAGTSWNNIGTATAAARAYTWTVPSSLATAPSGQLRVRVVRGAQSSSSENLSVIGVPANLQFVSVCPTETRLSWNAVTGATGYEIFKLGTTTMESVGTTTGLAFTVTGVSSTVEQWFSVRATGANGLIGRRANALRRAIGTSNCPAFPPPTISSFSPTSGPAGTVVTITGTNFTGATAVSFNGTNAPTFTVVSSTTINVTVPAGALSGPITITAPNGQATSSQSFNTGNYVLNDNLPVTTCSGALYDSGGPGGNYSNNENYTKTFTPATTGAKLRMVFTAFDTEATYDFLYIYDGATTSAPLIGTYHGTAGPGTVTATNANGQLTLRFTSDGSVTPSGFEATISCVMPAAPTLTSLSPTSGPVGTSVTLTGTNFTGATGVSFNGTAASTFSVTSATTATATVPAGATSGNVTITTPNGTSNGVAFTVVTPTAVTSIVPAGSSPTNAGSVSYTVTFSAQVTGVTVANFSLTAVGVAGASVSSVSGSGSTYTVTVSTGSGDGTLRLNLANSSGISPGVSNSPYTSGQAYTIDKTPPTATITSSTGANGSTSSSATFAYTVTFSESVTGFTAADVTVSNGSLSGFSGSGTTYTFAITPAANGPVTVSIAANMAADAAGNGNTAAAQYSITYSQPVTAAPALTSPANGSSISSTTPTYSGTAVANSTVTVYVNGTSIGTTQASAGGSWSLTQPTPLAYTTHTAAATAQASGSAVSASSASSTFTVSPPNLSISTGTATTPIVVAAGTYNNITITGTGYGQLGGAVVVNGALQVAGSLYTNCQPLTGPGSFTLAAGATLGICDAAGLSNAPGTGAVQTTGARSFSPDATYLYHGRAAQVTGAGLPATVATLAVDNPNGPVQLTQALALTRELRLTRGVFSLNGRALTLLSDNSTTAQVNQDGVTTTGTVTGGVATVQRFVPANGNAGLGYRHFASPVSGNTLADLAVPGSFQPVFNGAYNSSSTPAQLTPFPTVFGFDAARIGTAPSSYTGFDQGWYSPATASTPDAFTTGRGYAVHLAANQTVDFVGPLNQTAVSMVLPRAAGTAAPDDSRGWHLLGNPFASAFALASLDNTPGVDNAKYIFQSSGPYAGSYETYLTGLSGQPLLALGQGFFARASTPGTAPVLSFALAGRRVDFSTNSTFHRGSAETRPLLELALANAAGSLRDRTTLYADARATTGPDPAYDAVKLPNAHGLNLAQLAAGQRMAVNALPAFGASTLVPLSVGVPAPGTYVLQVNQLLNLPAGTTVVLVDALLGTRTDLATLPVTGYVFTLSGAQAATPLTGRFFLNLGAVALGTAASQAGAAMQLFPNPAHGGAATLTGAAPGLPVTVLDALGRTVLSTTADSLGKAVLTLPAGLATGVYVVRSGAHALRLVVD